MLDYANNSLWLMRLFYHLILPNFLTYSCISREEIYNWSNLCIRTW